MASAVRQVEMPLGVVRPNADGLAEQLDRFVEFSLQRRFASPILIRLSIVRLEPQSLSILLDSGVGVALLQEGPGPHCNVPVE